MLLYAWSVTSVASARHSRWRSRPRLIIDLAQGKVQ